jgi:hypothetical protein
MVEDHELTTLFFEESSCPSLSSQHAQSPTLLARQQAQEGSFKLCKPGADGKLIIGMPGCFDRKPEEHFMKHCFQHRKQT